MGVVRENTGMLLVAASDTMKAVHLARMKYQAFYAIMNLVVKELNDIGPPVRAMK